MTCAASSVGINKDGISKCCSGEKDEAGGFGWKRADATDSGAGSFEAAQRGKAVVVDAERTAKKLKREPQTSRNKNKKATHMSSGSRARRSPKMNSMIEYMWPSGDAKGWHEACYRGVEKNEDNKVVEILELNGERVDMYEIALSDLNWRDIYLCEQCNEWDKNLERCLKCDLPRGKQ
jgi:hypothetical protein